MTPKRWAQLKDLYRSILEQPPEERQKMLGGIRDIDPSLCAELESLLQQTAQPSDGADSGEKSSQVLQQRMLDAAIANLIAVYRPAELAVLVRRMDSAGLATGLPAEQVRASTAELAPPSPVQLDFPLDPEGRLKPLDLHIRIVCLGFEPKSVIKTIQVPPAGDSQISSILITPRVLGELTVQLELFQGEASIASRVLKTEVRPSERYIGDPGRVVASIPLPVLARGTEVAPVAPPQQEAGELGSTLELPAAPDAVEPAPEPPPAPLAEAPPYAAQEPAGFTRMDPAHEVMDYPASQSLAAAAPGDYVQMMPGELPTPILAPPPSAPVAAPQPVRRSPMILVLAIFGPLFLLAIAIIVYLAIHRV